MTDAKTRSDRIRDKIDSSDAQLKADGHASSAQLPDAYPPESYRSLAGEYPWLAVAAGAGAGLLIGALLPRRFGGKLGRRALAAATVAAELGLAYSRQARASASDAASDGLDFASEKTAPLRANARRMAGSAGSQMRGAGLAIMREAADLATRAARLKR